MNANEIQAKIADLSADVAVATNEGTHGLDPQFHNWTKMEKLDGTQYYMGKYSEAGRTRHLTHESVASRRAQIASLRALATTAETESTQHIAHVDALSRGWDGYQFIGVEAGKAKAAELAGK